MIATALFALLLITISGLLAGALKREASLVLPELEHASNKRFVHRRYVRRMIANTSIGIVAVMVAAWPLVPREPIWIAGYVAGLTAMAVMILWLGLSDAFASGKQYQAESHQRLVEETERLLAAIEAEMARQETS